MRIAKCENEKCIKSSNCHRYKDATADVVSFKNICYLENKYRWYMPIEKEKDVEALDIGQKEEKTDNDNE